MKSLRQFLEPLLAGKAPEASPANALATAIWVLTRRLEEMNFEVWRKSDECLFKRLFERRLQLQEDIAVLEGLHRRAVGLKPFEDATPKLPVAGPGYGEI